MRNTTLWLASLLTTTLAFTGCSGDDSTSSAGNTSPTSSSTSAASTSDASTSTSDASTSTSASSESGGSGSDTGTTTSDTTTTTTTTTTTSGTGETDSSTTAVSSTSTDTTAGSTGDAVCNPSPNANECEICMSENCCDELMACDADEDCTCFMNCIIEGTMPQQCAQMCMVNPMENDALNDRRMCNMEKCGDFCMG